MAETPDVKVVLVGPADSGKTTLIKFLKGINYQTAKISEESMET